MRTGRPDGARDTADANRRFYASIAESYDRLEECVADERLQARLRERLSAALALVPPPVRALDACGGSGNASLMLHSLGVAPTTVDLSPEMLGLYERKAAARGVETRTHLGEIGAFLTDDPGGWDVIVFSSALHHLDDYEAVLELAAARLAPGGVIVTVFDATATGAVGRWVRRVDYIAHVCVRDPARAAAIIRRRLQREAPDAVSAFGDRAERHALKGIDDLELRRSLEAGGLEIVEHERTYDGRLALTRVVYRLLRTPSSFSLIVRTPDKLNVDGTPVARSTPAA